MKLNRTKTRWLLCGTILIAFFIPAYNGVSAAGFISHALAEAETHAEITKTDVLIVIIPLLFVPASVIAIFIRSYFLKRSVRIIYLMLPLFFTAAFLGILFFFAADGTYSFTSPRVLLDMQFGFYVHVLASSLLVFTKKHRRKTARFEKRLPGTAAIA